MKKVSDMTAEEKSAHMGAVISAVRQAIGEEADFLLVMRDEPNKHYMFGSVPADEAAHLLTALGKEMSRQAAEAN